MTKSHLKKMVAPRTWKIKRKSTTFIVRPKPGGHAMNMSIPLKKVLFDTGKAETMREASYILHNHEVQVDLRKKKDPAFPVGLFDIISFPEINEAYTIIINKWGKLVLKKLNNPKSDKKLIKIINKRKVKGNNVQIETYCGRNIVVDDKKASKFKTGDTLIIKLPEQKIVDHKKLEKGSKVYITKGSHVESIVEVKQIKNEKMICLDNKKELETKKAFAFVIIDEIEKLLK